MVDSPALLLTLAIVSPFFEISKMLKSTNKLKKFAYINSNICKKFKEILKKLKLHKNLDNYNNVRGKTNFLNNIIKNYLIAHARPKMTRSSNEFAPKRFAPCTECAKKTIFNLKII